MKIFDRDGKINFVDENNVFVGFSSMQSCCEFFGYGFSAEKESASEHLSENANTESYVFDTEFFHKYATTECEDGGCVSFRLTKAGQPDLYLHLFNHHNGYYSHGFTFETGEKLIEQGWI